MKRGKRRDKSRNRKLSKVIDFLGFVYTKGCRFWVPDLAEMAVRTPITGISMASAPSISSSNRVVVKVTPFRASFFGQGVGAVKLAGLQLTRSNRSRCNSHGGVAIGACMNLFDWFGRVVKSYANALISSFEDPEKILEQTVLE